MRRQVSMSIVAMVMVVVLASTYTQQAYALNYRPVEFIREVDGTTLVFPFALAMDDEGRLIVTDADRNVGKVYVMKKGEDGNWHMLGSFSRRSAVDLSFDSQGRLAVLTHVHPEGAIYLYQLNYGEDGSLESAEIVHSVQGSTSERTLFMFPHGLTTLTQDGHDLIAIGDNLGRRVQVYEVTEEGMSLAFQFNNAKVYDASGSEIGDVVDGSQIDPWPSILDVKTDGSGNIIVAYKIGLIGIYSIDFEDSSVSVRLIKLFGHHGADLGEFNEPRGVAYDQANNYLIVSDNLNHRIQVFNYDDVLNSPNPMPVFYFGSGIAGDGERQLNAPRKVMVKDDAVYVVDGGNGRIAVLVLDESIPNDVDEPRIEPLRGSEWYKFTNHREMFNMMGRLLYTALIDNGVQESIATRTALNTTAEELGQVLVQIRTLPNDARLNIPWSSHLKGNTILQGDVFFKVGCTIGKQGSTGIGDPREYHPPPVQVSDTLYCSTTAASLYGSGAKINVNSVSAYFVDPDGVERDVYYYTSDGRHVGIRGMSINPDTEFYWEPFAVDIDKPGRWRLVNEYSNSNGARVEVELEFYVGNSYSFSSSNELLDAIGAALSNSGFTEEEVQEALQAITSSEYYNALPEQGTLIMEVRRGSLYAFGCILPHDPPLNIGESIQCLVLYMSLGSPVTVDDLHVIANAPSGPIPIQVWNWAPGTIPDPFIWQSPPIPMTEAGDWSIVADFTRGGTVVLSIPVTFNVVPESLIGAIGVVGGSFAVIAHRMMRRRGKGSGNQTN